MPSAPSAHPPPGVGAEHSQALSPARSCFLPDSPSCPQCTDLSLNLYPNIPELHRPPRHPLSGTPSLHPMIPIWSSPLYSSHQVSPLPTTSLLPFQCHPLTTACTGGAAVQKGSLQPRRLPGTGLPQGSVGRGSHKQACRQDRDMPRKRPTPCLQQRQPRLRSGPGERGQGGGVGWAEPWAQGSWAR